ncbi:DUF3466 family protein [Vibrio fluvialis]|uniref:DUF3466 family protein n=1 Tax=Vibrio fluvialis TaxID=676 RepID=UPI00192AF51A|nr:DUF3466 family protein [Vibrio fluvialis]MBL4294185.1 DUF3466 family protein [Vibrio fluvialis]WDY53792.1 DUF3466 family protein [Vibrio fluvialis]
MKPMSSNTFKLTFITAAIVSSTTASAALYQVVEVTPSTTYSYKSSFGVAIQPGTATGGSDADLGCFDSAASNCDGNSFTLAGETRSSEVSAGEAVDGLSFREEAPFGMDSRFIYIDSLDDFESYCNNQLRYATCDAWASVRWTPWASEVTSDTTPNAIAFTGESTTGDSIDEGNNVVVNSLTSGGKAVGIKSTLGDVTGYRRNSVSGFVEDSTTFADTFQTRAWKTDDNYTVGSVSTKYTNDGDAFYTSKAALWNSDGDLVQINWGSGSGISSVKNSRFAQGSMRDFVEVDGTLYGVGYNTYETNSTNYMNAVVYSVSTSSDIMTASNWTSTPIANATVRENGVSSGDYIYSNSVALAVNENLVAIGEAKRDGDHPYKGAASNRVFVVKDVTSPSATYLSDGVFFDGAGGKAGGINNYNEIVGQVDAESIREVSGKPRRKRAFIYPLDSDGTNETRRGIFSNKSWWLDNLTNGGTYSSHNNQYRIIDATDINDAGVISATALKCDGGYDTTAYNATCGNGSQDETTVAVKLVPIPGARSDDISSRGTDETAAERKGAGVGLWMLAVLGFLGFRRK